MASDEGTREAVTAGPDPVAEPAATIAIVYGSETGTSETLARKLGRMLRAYTVTVCTLDAFAAKYAAGSTHDPVPAFTLVLTSTVSDGLAPTGARTWPTARLTTALRSTAFAVLALGSSVYPKFCAFGRRVDRDLRTVGAQQLLEVTLADETKGQDRVFQQWATAVQARLPPPPESATVATSSENPAYTLRMGPVVPDGVGRAPSRYMPLVVQRNDELLVASTDPSRSTRHIVVAAAPGSAWASYETGDHLAILPSNPPALISRLLAAVHDVGASNDTTVTLLQGGDALVDGPFTNGSTLADVLGRQVSLRLDVGMLPPWLHALLHARLAATGKDGTPASDAVAAQLQAWLDAVENSEDDGHAAVQSMIDTYVDVPAVLEALQRVHVAHTSADTGAGDSAHDSTRDSIDNDASNTPRDSAGVAPPAAGPLFGLADVLPFLSQQKARFYSISSSARKHPAEAHITVGLLNMVNAKGVAVAGLCSTYLAGLAVGDVVQATLHTSSFRYPADRTSPVVMAAIGTGLAPFVAFMEEREMLPAPRGPSSLFFGCRTRDDVLYRDHLTRYLSDDSASLTLALSRNPGLTREYVQESLTRNGAAVCEQLLHARCHYYFCGDGAVSDACYNALVGVLQQFGKMNRIAAVNHLDVMRVQGRFQLDVWGVTLANTAASELDRLRTATKKQAWLRAFYAAEHAAPEAAQPADGAAAMEQDIAAAFNAADIDGSGELNLNETLQVCGRVLYVQ